MKGLKINKYKLVAATSIILLVLTPWLNRIVNTFFRSGNAQQHGFGSECLLWLFPIMVLGLVDALNSKDI